MSLLRMLAMVPLVVAPIVAVGDLGSVVVVRMTVPDDAHEAGRAATMAIERTRWPQAATSRNAVIAYDAASSVATLHRQEVDPESFTVLRDGSVHLTVRRTAPTVILKHLPVVRRITTTSTTTTVEPLRY